MGKVSIGGVNKGREGEGVKILDVKSCNHSKCNGHVEADCRPRAKCRANGKSTDAKKMSCPYFNCKGEGHISHNCSMP